MSYTTALGIVPDRRPVELAKLRNPWGWAPSIWQRILKAHDVSDKWILDDSNLVKLWRAIDNLPDWQQAPLILTFDTGVIPWQEYEWAADQIDEFDRRIPPPDGHVNHLPAMAELLRSKPEVPLFGVYGTSVSDNPFDPWDEEADAPGSGIPLTDMIMLAQHRRHLPPMLGASL